MKNRGKKPPLRKQTKNPLRVDPTRTTTLRRQFESAIIRRMNRVKARIIELIEKGDALGLVGTPSVPFNAFCPTGKGGGVDPTCSPHGSKSGGMTLDVSEGAKVAARNFFGREVDMEEVAKGAGALPGSKVIIRELPGVDGLGISIDHPEYKAERKYYRHGKERRMQNTKIEAEKEGGGLGTRMLYHQVQALDKLGVDRITASAARDDEKGYVGYKVWGKLGYDGKIPDTFKNPLGAWANSLPRKFHKAETVSELMRIDGGREAWEKYGGTFNAEFVVRDSPHRKTLDDYVERRLQAGTLKLNRVKAGFLTFNATKGAEEIPLSLREIRELDRYTDERNGFEYPNKLTPEDEWDDVPGKDRSTKLRESEKLTGNANEWQLLPDAMKLQQFQEWLYNELETELVGDDLWRSYIEEGYQKGAARAFSDYGVSNFEQLGFYVGTKEQFLRSSFAQPVAQEKVKLLVSRTLNEFQGFTDAASQILTRTLADGLVQGKSPRDVARDLINALDGITRKRALDIAQTETIRAHADGQLTTLKSLGVTSVGVAVEWSTTGDFKVCPKCKALEGIVLSIDEAQGLIPRHVRCRCAWIPANVGENQTKQKRTKVQILEAMKASKARDKSPRWVIPSIAAERPEGIMNNSILKYFEPIPEVTADSRLAAFSDCAREYLDIPIVGNAGYVAYHPKRQHEKTKQKDDKRKKVDNVFCATGKGGGVVDNAGCGAGATGKKGFQPGNKCAKGRAVGKDFGISKADKSSLSREEIQKFGEGLAEIRKLRIESRSWDDKDTVRARKEMIAETSRKLREMKDLAAQRRAKGERPPYHAADEMVVLSAEKWVRGADVNGAADAEKRYKKLDKDKQLNKEARNLSKRVQEIHAKDERYREKVNETDKKIGEAAERLRQMELARYDEWDKIGGNKPPKMSKEEKQTRKELKKLRAENWQNYEEMMTHRRGMNAQIHQEIQNSVKRMGSGKTVFELVGEYTKNTPPLADRVGITEGDELRNSQGVKEGRKWVMEHLDGSLLDEVTQTKLGKHSALASGSSERAYEHNGDIFVRPHHGASSVVHEFGHAVGDTRNEKISETLQGFLFSRVKNDRIEIMPYLMPGEVGWSDKFDKAFPSEGSAPYVGKHYPQKATEIFSMGLEKMYTNPGELVKDPQMFRLILGIMAGKFSGD